MEQNVIISIVGTQSYEDVDDTSIELITEGEYHDLGDEGYTLSYQESELTGLDGTLTTFRVEPTGRVILLREGEVNSQMVFEEGRRHLSLYETPQGSMSIGVSTKSLRATMTDTDGELEIKYAIEINNTLAGENLFHIKVRENTRTISQ